MIAIFVLIIIIGGVFVAISLSNPMRKSEAVVRDYILELTPVGTSKEKVIKFIENNAQQYKDHRHYDWFINYETYDHGMKVDSGRAMLPAHGYEYDESELTGKETIEAAVSAYIKFFEVTVLGCWAFDEDGKLVDVGVYKSSDSF